MKQHRRHTLKIALGLALTCIGFSSCASGPSVGKLDTPSINAESRAALRYLYAQNPKARALGARAAGVLVFPNITKGGFVVGGMGGNGALIMHNGQIQDHYQTGGLSYGLQAGVQKYGYALFLMDKQAFDNVNRTQGWELGGSPSLVIVDQGVAASLSTTTIDKGTYAVFFNQRGLMGGLSLQGSKITRIRQ